ncbi:VOC family protein [Kribbella sp. NBC_00359]|uniref:VOC family protein n=1 Tax=Kribbella sp. NBC_00359 TaxID=2975966 RepID=UPI003FA53096
MRTQVTFDCADPHAQAAFWAEVFGSVVEDHSRLVDQLVADGHMPAEDRIVVNGRSAFRDVAACQDSAGCRAPALLPARARRQDGEEPDASGHPCR